MNQSLRTNFFDGYFYLWAIFIPITSILVIPSIQGTTPAYIIALISLFLVPLLSRTKGATVVKELTIYTFSFVLLIMLGQLGLALDSELINYGKVITVSNDNSVLFRSSIITQSLYLLAAVSLFLFTKHYYSPKWDKYLFSGAIIIAVYGLYEVTYYLVFGQNGDFISNRTFGDENSGSRFQLIYIGSMVLMRLKSLTGEPSMYALTVVPYWIYALHLKKYKTSMLLLITLFLSTSTSAILGIFIYSLVRGWYFKFKDKLSLIFMGIGAILLFIFRDTIYLSANKIIVDKFALQSNSGLERFGFFKDHMIFFMNEMNWFNKIFGIGFGTVRSTDMFSTLLVNTGIIGLIVFTLIFLYPVVKLNPTYVNIGLKAILVFLFVKMMISSPEFAYLPTWLFLGIAYFKLNIKKELN
ncbi:hypothetical protein [Halobacillus sp. BBL2006]|uniref:hypothetical protein n=1 Tax=Halobacillus sp. BBL2006 TaxID=1543706 RepID=UPI000689ED83|nr:hypothetical protein [Halobacillus sp. BBL2006]